MITTKIAGFEVHYRDADDRWVCSELNIESLNLSSMRQRIAAATSKDRRINIPVILIEKDAWNGLPAGEIVVVTILCEPDRNESISHCWIKTKKGRRLKVRIDDLAPLSSSSDVNKWLALRAKFEDALAKAEKAHEHIARHDADSLMLAAKEAAVNEPMKSKRR